jgi:hypothetical protein
VTRNLSISFDERLFVKQSTCHGTIDEGRRRDADAFDLAGNASAIDGRMPL